ncbi:hypothetical protein RFI_27188 [Reticulomyxa filosa]|uniref:Uncharacterized protein n=1 Tax=Reticulomyxa filosa TaxID=46433 RepID=X6M958_RETFI|nr:hypothetical protein RFI_27188 [Reticulomyxa filosa]|eukprot:ETO10191.1 hypothetical protein RFI_27188 [Reticulomyxa filosa]
MSFSNGQIPVATCQHGVVGACYVCEWEYLTQLNAYQQQSWPLNPMAGTSPIYYQYDYNGNTNAQLQGQTAVEKNEDMSAHEETEYESGYDDALEYEWQEDSIEYEEMDYDVPYQSIFTMEELKELEQDIEKDMNKNEYLGMDNRPPPFEYDKENPPVLVTQEELKAGDVLCVYHPLKCVWFMNYSFVQFSKDTGEHGCPSSFEMALSDKRVTPEHQTVHVSCQPWPIIYRYIRPDNGLNIIAIVFIYFS